MLQNDTLQTIQTTAVKAAGLSIVPIPGDPRNVLVHANGACTELRLPPPDRKHRVFALDDLVSLAKKCQSPSGGALWHNAASVTAIFDGCDRRDCAVLALSNAAVWGWIMAMPSKLDQKAFLRALKTTLADSVDKAEAVQFIAALSVLRFSERQEIAADSGTRGREGLSRSIEQECSAANELPELLHVTTTINRELPELPAVTIPIHVEIDYGAKLFVLTPVGDSVVYALRAHQEALGFLIAEKLAADPASDIPVYFGEP